MAALLVLALVSSLAPARAANPLPAQERTGPLAALSQFLGTWHADASAFSTTLRYDWQIEGHVLGAANEVRNSEGRVIARYHGSYAWDAGRKEIVFWTAGESGEVHRGRAWWRDGVLWHEAQVSGGRITSYASALRLGGSSLEYFADYGATTAGPPLLETKPVVYARIRGNR